MEQEDGTVDMLKDTQLEQSSDEDSGASIEESMYKRGCPVPKPGGIVGELLGLKPSSSGRKGSKPP